MINMVKDNEAPLNRLERILPEGLIVDSGWLERRGYSSSLRTYYVKNGWLEQPARGAYRRRRGKLSWEQVVISLQTILEYPPLIVGGKTALILHGLTHYVTQEIREIHLYGPKGPPAWVGKLGLEQRFVYHNEHKLFTRHSATLGQMKPIDEVHEAPPHDQEQGQSDRVTSMAWGHWEWPLKLSTPERAILELLDELPQRESFHHVDKIMEGLSGLSPRRLQRLLSNCSSVKVKRLFFFFADRQQHAWSKRIDKTKIDLGSGKRMLVKGGSLDSAYLITVPGDLDDHY